MIRLTEIRLNEEAEERVLGVLRSGRLAQGPLVAEFESSVAAMAETQHAVAFSSGTTALVAAVEALGIGPGDEVITPSFTFVATLNAVLEAGATVRLVDILPRDFTLDPDRVEEAIRPESRAIVPVHLFGYPADMPKLAKIAAHRGLSVLEDAAQAHGAVVGTRPVGSWGIGVFSFYATKNITTGEGGAVTTDDDEIADRLRLLRNQGMRARYEYEILGHNYRMTELQAAVGLSQLPYLQEWTERRRRNARSLMDALADIDGLILPSEDAARNHVFHQFTLRVTDQSPLSRDELATALHEAGIETAVYYPRGAHQYACFAQHPRVHHDSLIESETAARQVLSIPVHQWLAEDDVGTIAQTVTDCLRK